MPSKISGWVERGSVALEVSGAIRVIPIPQVSYPLASVTVYDTGTLTISTIYDEFGSTVSNPFTATAEAQWSFYANPGRYDIRFSGGSPPVPWPFAIADICVPDCVIPPPVTCPQPRHGIDATQLTMDPLVCPEGFTCAPISGPCNSACSAMGNFPVHWTYEQNYVPGRSDTLIFDFDDTHSNTVNNSRITVSQTGNYLFGALIHTLLRTSPYSFSLTVRKNGSINLATDTVSNSLGLITAVAVGSAALNAGDYLEVVLNVGTGSIGTAGGQPARFWVVRDQNLPGPKVSVSGTWVGDSNEFFGHPTTWTTENYDVGGMFDPLHPLWVTIPTAGVYYLEAQYSGSVLGFFQLGIEPNNLSSPNFADIITYKNYTNPASLPSTTIAGLCNLCPDDIVTFNCTPTVPQPTVSGPVTMVVRYMGGTL